MYFERFNIATDSDGNFVRYYRMVQPADASISDYINTPFTIQWRVLVYSDAAYAEYQTATDISNAAMSIAFIDCTCMTVNSPQFSLTAANSFVKYEDDTWEFPVDHIGDFTVTISDATGLTSSRNSLCGA